MHSQTHPIHKEYISLSEFQSLAGMQQEQKRNEGSVN